MLYVSKCRNATGITFAVKYYIYYNCIKNNKEDINENIIYIKYNKGKVAETVLSATYRSNMQLKIIHLIISNYTAFYS